MNGFIVGGICDAGLNIRGVPCEEIDGRWLVLPEDIPSWIDSLGLMNEMQHFTNFIHF